MDQIGKEGDASGEEVDRHLRERRRQEDRETYRDGLEPFAGAKDRVVYRGVRVRLTMTMTMFVAVVVVPPAPGIPEAVGDRVVTQQVLRP